MKTGELEVIDRKHSWHKYTPMESYSGIMMERGEGSYLIDSQGKRYLDGIASMWSNVHGYSDEDLKNAIREQLEMLPHSSYVNMGHPKAAELTKLLIEETPGNMSRVFFNNNGGTAIDTALKMSFQHWQNVGEEEKRMVLSMQGGHHGSTIGGSSVGDVAAFHDRFKHWGFPCEHFPHPGEGSLKGLEDLLKKYEGKTACVILETGAQIARAMALVPKGFLKEVHSLCKKYDVHLILDEVFSGFGRMGPMLVSHDEGVEADFTCVGKGLSGGYLPLAATVTTEEIHESFCGGNPFWHGHMHSGNPMACACAVVSIQKLRRRMETGDHYELIKYFEKAFAENFEGVKGIDGIRQRGFVGAIDLNESIDANQVCKRARESGVLVRGIRNSIFFIPPLSISREEIDILFTTTRKVINR